MRTIVGLVCLYNRFLLTLGFVSSLVGPLSHLTDLKHLGLANNVRRRIHACMRRRIHTYTT
jgi:hypothetical protein